MKKTILSVFLATIFIFFGCVGASNYTQELQDAYAWAYSKKITTMPTIDKANMHGEITRAQMAKMLSNWAKDRGQNPNSSKVCSFTDTESVKGDLAVAIVESCQLGLMGQGITKFRPNDTITRAEFGTALSRALWGTQYEGGEPYYKNHLNALKTAKIMNNITIHNQNEIRGYVMLMLMRANESNGNNVSDIKNKVSEIIDMIDNGSNNINNDQADNKNLDSNHTSENVNFCKNSSFRIYDYEDENRPSGRYGEQRFKQKNWTYDYYITRGNKSNGYYFRIEHFLIDLNNISWNDISSIKLKLIGSLDYDNIKSIDLKLFYDHGKNDRGESVRSSVMSNGEVVFNNLRRNMKADYGLIVLNLKEDIPYTESLNNKNTIGFEITEMRSSNCIVPSVDNDYIASSKFIDFPNPEEIESNKFTLTVNNSQAEYGISDSYYEVLNFTLDVGKEASKITDISIYNNGNLDLQDYIDDVKIFINGKDADNIWYGKYKETIINDNKITINNLGTGFPYLDDFRYEGENNFSIKIKPTKYNIAGNYLAFYIKDKADINLKTTKTTLNIGNLINVGKEYADDNKKIFNANEINNNTNDDLNDFENTNEEINNENEENEG